MMAVDISYQLAEMLFGASFFAFGKVLVKKRDDYEELLNAVKKKRRLN